jgi:dTDP-4-dehydrorhamnose 3,5-epimerase
MSNSPFPNLTIHTFVLPDLILIEPKIFSDERGFFLETWNQAKYKEIGIPSDFVQDNMSYSKKEVLRGLHFQFPSPQGKLLQVMQGEIQDIAVDIRKDSPTFGKWESVILSAENKKQLYIPEGFAHGFLVISESALVSYKCTEFYYPENEKTILWNDSQINIKWETFEQKIISDKDQKGLRLEQILDEALPAYVRG